MNKKLLLAAGVISTVAIIGLSTTAFAWHPKAGISKKVQNITAGSSLSEADTASAAVAAKPGDTLKYVIEVRNDGTPDSRGYNDMAKTVMKDTLPAGIELVGNPAQRTITENLGTLKPGQKVTKEYTVKVTASKNGIIENTACVTGGSTANDNPQNKCNPAVVKVTVPTSTITTPVKTPETPAPKAEVPAELPTTGPESIFGAGIVLGIAWFALHRYVASRREMNKALLEMR